MTKIIAGGIANLTDARYFAAWNVDFMAFSLEGDENASLQASTIYAIKEWVEGPKFLGEFTLQTVEEIIEIVKVLKLDGVVAGPFYSLQSIQDLGQIPVYKKIVVEAGINSVNLEAELAVFSPHVSGFILDFTAAGINYTSLKGSHSLSATNLKDLCNKFNIYLNIDAQSENISELIETVSPTGLLLMGGEEEQVGFKSFDDMDATFEVLEEIQ